MTRITEQEFARIVARQAKPEKAATLPAPSEQQEQEAVIQWAHVMSSRWPELRLLASIPNGELRDKATAVRLKKAGVLAGMPDLLLAARRGGYGALFLELKRRDRSNHASPAQKVIHELLEEAGYRVCVVYGSEEAIEAIENYLMLSA